ncbi:MAG: DUF2797 domain-containing protein [Flavobacteriales bacterium]|nr:DUF2797 domain-containing protein [Flavobacteriales bacterium]
MRTSLENGSAMYKLPLFDILDLKEEVDMNSLIGQEIRLSFSGDIHCRYTGDKIKKTFGEGLSYKAFRDSPLATESIIRPELSRIHEGIALRDEEWEKRNHLTPHVTYLSLTSGIKVGVTRQANIPSRWIDQGATQAIVLAETPYRQAAGLIEVGLKEYLNDKTNWRNMLKGIELGDTDLLAKKNLVKQYIDKGLLEFWSNDEMIVSISYPVLRYPVKVTSLKLDKMPIIEKKLTGIKGQYLIFSDDTVLNVRSHSAYRISLEVRTNQLET